MDEEKKVEEKRPRRGSGGAAKNVCNCPCCGGGGCHCGWGGGHRFSILRVILGLVIVGFVFSAGVKVGELKGAMESQFGFSHHQRWGGNYNYGPMMNWSGGPVGNQMMVWPVATTTAAATKAR